MKKLLLFSAFAFIAMITISSCKKEFDDSDGQRQWKKTATQVDTTKKISFQLFYTGPTKSKGGIGNGEINNYDTVKFDTFGLFTAHTVPVTSCNWTVSGNAIKNFTSIDQISFYLGTTGLYKVHVAPVSNGLLSIDFWVKLDTASKKNVIVYPYLSGKLLRFVGATQNSVTGAWTLTWRAYREGTTPTNLGYGYVNSSKNDPWTLSYDASIVIMSSDTFSYTEVLQQTTNISTRQKMCFAQGPGNWLHYNSTLCPFWDPTYDGDNNGIIDDLISYYFDGLTGTLKDAHGNIVYPSSTTFNLPGAFGDIGTNAQFRGQWVSGTQLNLYFYSGTNITNRHYRYYSSNTPITTVAQAIALTTNNQWITGSLQVSTSTGYGYFIILAGGVYKYTYIQFDDASGTPFVPSPAMTNSTTAAGYDTTFGWYTLLN